LTTYGKAQVLADPATAQAFTLDNLVSGNLYEIKLQLCVATQASAITE